MYKALLRLASPWACAWLVSMPSVQAAEQKPAAQPAPAAQATPFAQYQGWRDDPLRDWREANDRVGEIGGWRTYLRESQQEAPAADHGHRGH